MSAKRGLQHATKQDHSRTMSIAGTSDTGTEHHETFLLPRNKQLRSPLHPTVLREVHRHDHRASQDHNRHTSAPLDHTTRIEVRMQIYTVSTIATTIYTDAKCCLLVNRMYGIVESYLEYFDFFAHLTRAKQALVF